MCAETGEGGDSGRWPNPSHVCGQSSPMVKDCSFGVVREGKGVEGGGPDLIERGFGRKRTWRLILFIFFNFFLSFLN